MPTRQRTMSPPASQAGRASLEFLTAAIVVLIPLLYLSLNLAAIANAQLAAEAAARNAVRVFARETSLPLASWRAETAAAVALANHGISPPFLIERDCSIPGCLAPGSLVTIRVSLDVDVVGSAFLPGSGVVSVPVSATSQALVSRYGGEP